MRSQETTTGIYLDLDQVAYAEATLEGVYLDVAASYGEAESGADGLYMHLPLATAIVLPLLHGDRQLYAFEVEPVMVLPLLSGPRALFAPEFVGRTIVLPLLSGPRTLFAPQVERVVVFPLLSRGIRALHGFTVVTPIVSLPALSGPRELFLFRVKSEANLQIRTRETIRRVLANRYGPVEMRTRMHVSNIGGDVLGELTGIRSAGVDLSNFRDTTWQLNLSMDVDKDFDVFSDWIKSVVELKVMGEWVEYPMGLYKFTKPSFEYGRSSNVLNLTGYSAELLILEDTIRNVRTVKAGAEILKTVRDLLLESGVPIEKINLPYHLDKPLRSDITFDPFSDDSKAVRLRIVNTLLNAGAFGAVWVDRLGAFTTQPYADIRDQEPAVYYGPGEDEENLVIDSVSDDWDDGRFYNAVIVTEQNPNTDAPIRAFAQNDDPNSPASFQRLGRWKLKHIKMSALADQESANTIARAQLQAASGYYRTIKWNTPPDPERGAKEYFSMHIPDRIASSRGIEVKGLPPVIAEGGEQEEEEPTGAAFRGDGFDCEIHPFPKSYSFSGARVEAV